MKGSFAHDPGPVVLALSISVAAACSSSSGASVSASQASTHVGTALCTKINSCSAYFDEVTWGDVAACGSRTAASLMNVLAATGTGWTPSSVDACARAAASTACNDALGNNLPGGVSCARRTDRHRHAVRRLVAVRERVLQHRHGRMRHVRGGARCRGFPVLPRRRLRLWGRLHRRGNDDVARDSGNLHAAGRVRRRLRHAAPVREVPRVQERHVRVPRRSSRAPRARATRWPDCIARGRWATGPARARPWRSQPPEHRAASSTMLLPVFGRRQLRAGQRHERHMPGPDRGRHALRRDEGPWLHEPRRVHGRRLHRSESRQLPLTGESEPPAVRQTPTSRICRLFVGVKGIAYCPEKQAWQNESSPPRAASIPSSDRYPTESAVTYRAISSTE